MSLYRRLIVISFARADHLNQDFPVQQAGSEGSSSRQTTTQPTNSNNHPRLNNPTDHHIGWVQERHLFKGGVRQFPELLHSLLPVEDIDQVRVRFLVLKRLGFRSEPLRDSRLQQIKSRLC